MWTEGLFDAGTPNKERIQRRGLAWSLSKSMTFKLISCREEKERKDPIVQFKWLFTLGYFIDHVLSSPPLHLSCAMKRLFKELSKTNETMVIGFNLERLREATPPGNQEL